MRERQRQNFTNATSVIHQTVLSMSTTCRNFINLLLKCGFLLLFSRGFVYVWDFSLPKQSNFFYRHITAFWLGLLDEICKLLCFHFLWLSRFAKTKHFKNVGPIHYCEPLTPIHQVSPVVLSRAACASMSTTTTRDRGDHCGPMEWAQLANVRHTLSGDAGGPREF